LGEEVDDDLQGIKEVIKEGWQTSQEKTYLVLLLFVPIFLSQPEDSGEGMGAKKISVPACSRAGKTGA
jgi:hypothetical protein